MHGVSPAGIDGAQGLGDGAGVFASLHGQAGVGPAGEEVEGGSSLSEAMAKYPSAFDRLFTKMVNAGEIGGVLPVEHMTGALQTISKTKPAHRIAKAVAQQDASDLVQATEIAGGVERFQQHRRDHIGRPPRCLAAAQAVGALDNVIFVSRI